jgi:hypothetical protein
MFPLSPVVPSPCFLSCTGAAGAAGTRPSLRPPFSEGLGFWHNSGATRRGNADACLRIRVRAVAAHSLSCPLQAGHPVRRGFSMKLCRLWNTGSPGQAGRRRRNGCLTSEPEPDRAAFPRNPCCVGRAKALLRRAHHPPRSPGWMVGTLRFAHPTNPPHESSGRTPPSSTSSRRSRRRGTRRPRG